MKLIFVSIFLLSVSVEQIFLFPSNFKNAFPKCGYNKCPTPDPNKLNVHLVPHTHDDVGWLKTVDQYYYGSNNGFAKAGVQYIIDSAVQELLADPKRRFIYVEMAFFQKWWKDQDAMTKALVFELVQEGRLEFINGGWAMNDEAATHYNSIIDQMTWGMRKLEDQFGKCARPKVGWHIDPFGHSREMANLLSQFSMDGFFFARIDYQDFIKRKANKTMELVWRGSDDLGKSSDIFTHVMANGYGPPGGFCYDLTNCRDDPIIDDPASEDYNVDQVVANFVSASKSYAQFYTTNNIMFPMGSDFQYQDAHVWFKNMDKLIKYVNTKQNQLNVFYSTPSCYLYSLYLANQTYTTKTDDFFPYGSDDHSYWTGYFTSRPALKGYERVGNNFLQVTKQVDVLAQLDESADEKVSYLREAMGILQHHDGVSGTEKQHVTNNYALKLFKGIEKSKPVIDKAYKKLLAKPTSKEPVPDQTFCDSLNISACSVTESNKPVAVTFYNPIARPVSLFAHLPVIGTGYQVLCPQGKNVTATLSAIPQAVLNIPGRQSQAKNELVFPISIPALGFSTYLVKPTAATMKQPELKPIKNDATVVRVGGKTSVALFDSKSGAFKGVELADGRFVPMDQSFHYYKGMKGDNKKSTTRASGAYVFRPDGQTPTFLGHNLTSTYTSNELFTEVHQQWTPWLSQVVRVYNDEDWIVFDWVVGPIPVDDQIGKEVIIEFNSTLKSNGVFFTDANGRQLLKRVRDFRPTWNYTVTEKTSGNYYPVNSRIAIRDQQQNVQLTVLNDRSQGGSSESDGQVELMVHRRLLYDDAFGVSEALNEPGFDGKGLVIRGQHYLLTSPISSSARQHRDLAQRLFLRPITTFATLQSTDDYYAHFQTWWSGLTNALPANVHMLTLEAWRDDAYLLRLEHLYQTGEDAQLSQPATVHLRNLLADLQVVSAVEMTLGANQAKQEAKRLQFRSSDAAANDQRQVHALDGDDLTVTLNPMEIRTFVIKLSQKLDK